MRHVLSLIAGVILGAASWGLGSVLSGTFEPFDSLTGFLTTQVMLSGGALLVALTTGGRSLTLLILGGYLGLNLYPYVFGGPETRAWALLAALTTMFLTVIPSLAGVAGLLIRRVRRKFQTANQPSS